MPRGRAATPHSRPTLDIGVRVVYESADPHTAKAPSTRKEFLSTRRPMSTKVPSLAAQLHKALQFEAAMFRQSLGNVQGIHEAPLLKAIAWQPLAQPLFTWQQREVELGNDDPPELVACRDRACGISIYERVTEMSAGRIRMALDYGDSGHA